MRTPVLSAIIAIALLCLASPAFAGTAEAEKGINDESQPSSLSKDEQMAEMESLTNAAEPFQGMEIKFVSETIPTYIYESETLTKAFEEFTEVFTEDVKETDGVRLHRHIDSGKRDCGCLCRRRVPVGMTVGMMSVRIPYQLPEAGLGANTLRSMNWPEPIL